MILKLDSLVSVYFSCFQRVNNLTYWEFIAFGLFHNSCQIKKKLQVCFEEFTEREVCSALYSEQRCNTKAANTASRALWGRVKYKLISSRMQNLRPLNSAWIGIQPILRVKWLPASLPPCLHVCQMFLLGFLCGFFGSWRACTHSTEAQISDTIRFPSGSKSAHWAEQLLKAFWLVWKKTISSFDVTGIHQTE